MFLERCLFLLLYQTWWHILAYCQFIIFSNGFLMFWFLWYQLRFILFHILFYLFEFCFLLAEPGQRFVNLAYPFKEPALSFIDFCFLLFFNFDFFISSLIFINFYFLLLTLVLLVLLFYNSSRLYVKFFIFTFLRKAYLAMNFYVLILRTSCDTSHRFSMVVFSLSFISRNF